MQVPAASDLVAGKFLRPQRTARGVYLDRRPGKNDVHMRFVWATPDKWVWMHMGEPPTKDEAVAWGEERAERIYFRPD